MATALPSAPLPVQDPIARRKRFENDPHEGMMEDTWIDYFAELQTTVDRAIARIHSATLTAQDASIGATDVTDGTLPAGVYRVSYYTRVTQAAGTSSSLQITIDWKDQAIVVSRVGTALTGNTLTTFEAVSFPIMIDQKSPVRFAATYASAGVPSMEFCLYVTLERIQI